MFEATVLICIADFYLLKIHVCDLTVPFIERQGEERRTDLSETEEGREGAVFPLTFAGEEQIHVPCSPPDSASMPASH